MNVGCKKAFLGFKFTLAVGVVYVFISTSSTRFVLIYVYLNLGKGLTPYHSLDYRCQCGF